MKRLRVVDALFKLLEAQHLSVHLHRWKFTGGGVGQKLWREPFGELVAGGRETSAVVDHVAVVHWKGLVLMFCEIF